MASSSDLVDIDVDAIRREEAIEQFIAITGATREIANGTLEAFNWNLELAINMHVDTNDISVIGGSTAPKVSHSSARMSTQDQPLIANSNSLVDDSQDIEVRAPIPPVRQVLVDDYQHGNSSYGNMGRRGQGVYEFRDFRAETNWMQEELANQADESQTPANSTKKITLENIFRPPLDLICRGTLEHAREEGRRDNKWLLVNVQHPQEFPCLVLNRDVWSHPTIKSIISEHFIFWQVYHDSNDGQRFMQFYNVATFPCVVVVDPRTGEKLRSWTATDAVTFSDLITEFLSENPSPNGTGNVENIASLRITHESLQTEIDIEKCVYDESEEMQLKAAIAASLKDTSKEKRIYVNSDDSDLETFDSENEELNVSSEMAIASHSNDRENKPKPSSTQSKPREETCTQDTDIIIDDTHVTQVMLEDWKQYLGPDNGKQFELIVRYPDGNKENVSFPYGTLIKALFLYLTSKGYNMNDYDLMTNFPKRNLKELMKDETVTIESTGIHPREILYIQHQQHK